MENRVQDLNAPLYTGTDAEAADNLIHMSQEILDHQTARKLRKLTDPTERNLTKEETNSTHAGEGDLATSTDQHLEQQLAEKKGEDSSLLGPQRTRRMRIAEETCTLHHSVKKFTMERGESRRHIPTIEATANYHIQNICHSPEVLPKTRKIEELNSMYGDPQLFFTKALFDSDVDPVQCRLLIPRKNVENILQTLLNGNERLEDGIDVVVYDEDGKEFFMVLKFWGKSPVLIKTWKDFLAEHRLQVHDTLTAWIFTGERRETERLPILMIIRRKL